MPSPPPPLDHVQYLDLGDYLYLAGAALDVAPEALFDVADLALASRRYTRRPPPSPESSSTPTW